LTRTLGSVRGAARAYKAKGCPYRDLTDRCKGLRERLLAFMDEAVYPAERVFEVQILASGDPHFHPPVMEELKSNARERGLWNLSHPHAEWGSRSE